MKLAQGVDLHFIKKQQSKTNHLTFRFSGQRQLKTMARRALVAQMLATSSEIFPTSRLLRERLANLYGTSLSTGITTRGSIHVVDIDVSFVSNRYVLGQEDLLREILNILGELLFRPLIGLEKYHTQTFETEKTNLMRYLEMDEQDQYYASNLGLQELYYDEESLQVSKYSSQELIDKENAYTAYQEFQRMLREDKIDIFLLGDFDDYQAARYLTQFPFEDREVSLQAIYNQPISNVVREKVVSKETTQSILQLGYNAPINYGDSDYVALLVAEGMLGEFSHSKLFSEVREKEGLSYSIGSYYDAFTGFVKIHAGIDKQDRAKVFSLINRQVNELKMGRFSSQLIQQTKQMLISNAKMSADHPKSLIEQTYNQLLFSDDTLGLSTFIDSVVKVNKYDIVKVIGKIKLQAVYFLEGE